MFSPSLSKLSKDFGSVWGYNMKIFVIYFTFFIVFRVFGELKGSFWCLSNKTFLELGKVKILLVFIFIFSKSYYEKSSTLLSSYELSK